jgi:hypothetical protein
VVVVRPVVEVAERPVMRGLTAQPPVRSLAAGATTWANGTTYAPVAFAGAAPAAYATARVASVASSVYASGGIATCARTMRADLRSGNRRGISWHSADRKSVV